MAKAFSVRLLNGKEPFLRRLACEVRFQDGQLYLDHTGRLLKKLLSDHAWVVSPDPNPQGTTVLHMIEGLRLSFSMHSASLDLDWSSTDDVIDTEEAHQFVIRAEQLLGFLSDELEVSAFERIGFRQWYYFSFDTKAETEDWLAALGLFSFSPTLLDSFKAKREAMGVSFVMRGQESHVRIALNGIERAAQLPVGDISLNVRTSVLSQQRKDALREALKKKRQRQINSSFAAVLDIDAYRTEPRTLELGSFFTECLQGDLAQFRNSLPKADAKKG